MFVAGAKHDENTGTIRLLFGGSGPDGAIGSDKPLVKLKFKSKENEGS